MWRKRVNLFMKGQILHLWTKLACWWKWGYFFLFSTEWCTGFPCPVLIHTGMVLVSALGISVFALSLRCQTCFVASSNQIHSHGCLDSDHSSSFNYLFQLFFSCYAQRKFKSLRTKVFYEITIDEMFEDFRLDFQIYNLPTNIGL